MNSVDRVGGADQGRAVRELDRFRGEFFRCLGRRADELFELLDALLCAEGPVQSLVGLCLAPEHRRGHGALYAAVNRGELDTGRLRETLGALPLPRMFGGRIVLGVDVSPWLRPARRPVPSGCSATSRAAAAGAMPTSGSRAGRISWWPRWRAGRPAGPQCSTSCGSGRPTTPPR